MPAIMGGDARIQEKFQDEEYVTQVEQMFREKFLENLGVSVLLYLVRIHLPHLRILKYFTDDTSVNFHDKVFLHFLQKFGKK